MHEGPELFVFFTWFFGKKSNISPGWHSKGSTEVWSRFSRIARESLELDWVQRATLQRSVEKSCERESDLKLGFSQKREHSEHAPLSLSSPLNARIKASQSICCPHVIVGSKAPRAVGRPWQSTA